MKPLKPPHVQMMPLAGTPKEAKTDREILLKDRRALEAIASAILANKWFSWIIVESWLKANHYLITPDPEWENQEIQPDPIADAALDLLGVPDVDDPGG